MRRWLSLACLLVAGSALAQAPQQRLNQTLSTLNQSKNQEEKLKRELADTQRDLQQMRSRATTLATSLQQNERDASKAEATLAGLNRNLAGKEKEFAARKKEYAQTVVSLMRMRQLPPTAMFAKPEQVDDMMRASEVMRSANAALARRARALKQDMEEVTALRQRVRNNKQQVTRQQAMLQEKQKQLAEDLKTRQRLQEKLVRDHRATSAQVAKLSRESASLQELIGKLQKAPMVAQKTTAAPSARPALGGLRLPVAGSVLHRFGDRKNANETYRGMVLSARNGATVVAPIAGEVVFTGPFMDYGRMVLLKHGDGYISLLAGLSSISVTLNQQVGKGEPVGTSTPKLYVELRQRSKPIDPAAWFANLPSRTAAR